MKKRTKGTTRKRGRGFDITKTLGLFKRELHIPGYAFCGPNTKLEKRLRRGDKPVNELDKACLAHDVSYLNKDLSLRHKADKLLEDRACERVKAKDSSIGERLSALGVTAAMKLKRKLGMGLVVGKKVPLSTLIRRVKKSLGKVDHKNTPLKRLVQRSVDASKRHVKRVGGKQNVTIAKRIIPVPKQGGFLPFLIPALSVLGALGGLGGSVASVVKTVNDIKNAKEQLEEQKRHNRAMEGVQISGSGLYLRPYKQGYGLDLGSKN